MIIALQALLLVETWLSRFKFPSHYTLVINGASECKMDVESTWISTLHQNGPCFNIALTISKNHLWESSLTQHWETMALRYFTTNELVYLVLFKDPAWIEVIEIAFGWGCGHIWLHNYTWGPVATLHDSGSVLGQPVDTFFWARTISWSRLLARVWSGRKDNGLNHPRQEEILSVGSNL